MRYFALLSLLLICTSCAPSAIRKNDAWADNLLKTHPEASGSITREGVLLHYVTRGVQTLPKIIFIHGTPGSWRSFAAFLEEPYLVSHSYIITPDRPGYGESNRGQPMQSLTRQAQLLTGLLDLGDPKQPAILVGHSYGGAVVARMAMQGDSRIKAIEQERAI
jgi:pimeloyl-ACP methyl ester carboxylesterase